jgi:hypothetical protein
MATRIIRDEITGIDGTTAKIEITIPDQGAVCCYRDEVVVCVSSTSNAHRHYNAHTRNGVPFKCTCLAYTKSPARWSRRPCVHARAALATLTARPSSARTYCKEIASAAREIGYVARTFRAEVRTHLAGHRIHRGNGEEGDLWAAVRAFEFAMFRRGWRSVYCPEDVEVAQCG